MPIVAQEYMDQIRERLDDLERFRMGVDKLIPCDTYRDPRDPSGWPKRTDEDLLAQVAQLSRSRVHTLAKKTEEIRVLQGKALFLRARAGFLQNEIVTTGRKYGRAYDQLMAAIPWWIRWFVRWRLPRAPYSRLP